MSDNGFWESDRSYVQGAGSCEIIISHGTFADIHRHLEHARIKHPWPEGMESSEIFRIAERELNEMGAAMLKGDTRGVRQEALDLIAVLVRVIEGDGRE